MKIMIASDIHGSAFYCRKMLKAFENERADKLLLLGDILYHGPRNDLPEEYAPKEVISMLNPLSDKILCVRGNCDTEVDQMVLDFPVLADYCILQTGHTTIYATHGHVYNEKHLPPVSSGNILLNGHFHVPACRTLYNGVIYMNPGSVSLPKENSEHQYMVTEDDRFTWKDLDGNVLMEVSL